MRQKNEFDHFLDCYEAVASAGTPSENLERAVWAVAIVRLFVSQPPPPGIPERSQEGEEE